ncbi:MAG TPA: tetratricopeptide repeat protein [Phenylobacterium sp.]|jgi:tetratricopeptide (TPR) repeat protein|uniref:tetratricopeptide repeat protein n=1 Tax=Phenylobacterium sp. TaxID=1871053 RepID=UPI002D4BFD71|nr:tetratricopeptide repeat protein [Phenylobacterium sp.]HZZ68687.1 tetratricopeptide repeat protein [Phenylobacterium sp.]
MEFKSGPIRLSVAPKPRDPAADQAQLLAIQGKLTAGDIEGAVALAERALSGGLEHPLIFNLAAERLESEDRYAEALALLERGRRVAPDDLGLRQALGLCLFRLQRFEEALPHFDAMIAAQPGFAQAHAARGSALEQLERNDEAEAAFRRAHELQPGNLLAIAGLASAASRRGDHGAARTLAEQVLAAEPGYPDAVIILARADLAQGEPAAAEARLHDLIADGRTPESQRKLAQNLIEDMRAATARRFDA